MEKIKKAWKEFLPYERVFYVLSLVFAALPVILFLASFGELNKGFVYLPIMGLTLMCQGIHLWRRYKGPAVISFCGASLLFGVVIAEFVNQIFG